MTTPKPASGTPLTDAMKRYSQTEGGIMLDPDGDLIDIEDARKLEQSLRTSEARDVAMRSALARAGKKFREYVGVHLSKGTQDGNSKAASNELMAELCERVLSPTAPNAVLEELERLRYDNSELPTWKAAVTLANHNCEQRRKQVQSATTAKDAAEARAKRLEEALQWALAKEPSPCRCMDFATPPHVCVAHKALAQPSAAVDSGKEVAE